MVIDLKYIILETLKRYEHTYITDWLIVNIVRRKDMEISWMELRIYTKLLDTWNWNIDIYENDDKI